jgi:hypothetical protein
MVASMLVQDAMVINAIPDWAADAVAPLGRVTAGQRLRRWGLSEVWRVRLAGGVPAESVIVKRAAGELAGEARRYRELVEPLGVEAPRLLAATGGDPAVLVLQDVGPDNLEQRPSAEGYREAARTLARIRATAAGRLAAAAQPGIVSIGAGLRRGTADFVDTARRAAAGVAALRPDLRGRLDESARVLVRRLDRLAGVPVTVVHGDFEAKNLVHAGGGRLVAVDWPSAYLHAHLGDLFSLMKNAGDHARELPAVFAAETGTAVADVLDQVATGRLCWTVMALRWVVEEGVHAIPEARGWIDELVELMNEP